MSVFICWSGPRSHKIANAVENLLKHMNVSPVFVSDHIEKGTTWFDSILNQLQDAQIGIVCLTSENLRSPWMHFEAGALARKLSPEANGGAPTGDVESARSSETRSRHRRRLFTLLHGVTAAEIRGPLSAYQATSTTQQDIAKLVDNIQQILTDGEQVSTNGVPPDTWEEFERALERATVPISKLISDLAHTLQRKTFNEPLHCCADQAWLARYDGARVTREKLSQWLDQVNAACPPHERELFQLLLTELDGYAMALQALLLKPVEFKLGSSGELEMDEGIKTSCENRRLGIKSMATRLLDPLNDPFTEEAVRFMAAETNEERKMIVHGLEGRIRQTWEAERAIGWKGPLSQSAMDDIAFGKLLARMLEPQIRQSDLLAGEEEPNQSPAVLRLRASSWDLDRIYYYLLVEYFGTAALRWDSAAPAASKGDSTEQQLDSADTEAGQTANTADYDLVCAARDVQMEVERYRAKSKGGSLMPMTYALSALMALCSRSAARSADQQRAIKSALTLVREELGDELKSEPGRVIERLLADIR